MKINNNNIEINLFECEGDWKECELGDLCGNGSEGLQHDWDEWPCDDLDWECNGCRLNDKWHDSDERSNAKWDENVVTCNEMLDNTIIRKFKNDQDGDDDGDASQLSSILSSQSDDRCDDGCDLREGQWSDDDQRWRERNDKWYKGRCEERFKCCLGWP